MNKSSQQGILKNTLFLYIRSLFVLIISLYTSRIILQALGVEEFGVYQLVGGIVTALSFLNSTMISAIQRFLSYEIGIGSIERINETFSCVINILFVFSIIIFIIILLCGNILINYMDLGNVPYYVARWVLFIMALSLILTINSVAYNSLLVANEDMRYFAIIDIINSLLKACIAYSLYLFVENKIIFYSFLLLILSCIILLSYIFICRHKYKYIKYKFGYNLNLSKKILSYSGWSSISSFTYMIRTQGLAILLNSYFGPLLNASYGIAQQIDSAVRTFSQNFQLAYSPRITKYYAISDTYNMNRLIYSGAKFSTILLLIVAIPIMIEIDYILKLWLGIVPEYAATIVRIILLQSIIISTGCNSNSAIQATGNIRSNEIISNMIDILILPTSLFVLKFSNLYYLPFIIATFFLFLRIISSILIMNSLIKEFCLRRYLYDIIFKIILITILSIIIPYYIITNNDEGLLRLVYVTFSFELVFLFLISTFNINHEEKNIIKKLIFKQKTD